MTPLRVRSFPTFLFLLVLFALSSPSHAQTLPSTNTNLEIYAGNLLPSGISGITEVMPVSGIMYGVPQQFSWIEFGAFASNANGANWYNANLSLKGEVPVQNIYAIFLIGADLNMYQGANVQGFSTIVGGHVGTGLGVPITKDLHFRANMNFLVNPGVTLSLTFGLEFEL